MTDQSKGGPIVTRGLYIKAHGDESVGIFPEAFTVAPENGPMWFESEEHLLEFQKAISGAFEIITGEVCTVDRKETMEQKEQALCLDDSQTEAVSFSLAQVLMEVRHWQKIAYIKVEGYEGGSTFTAAYQGKKHLSTKWGSSPYEALSALLTDLMVQNPEHANKCRLSGCDSNLGKELKRDKDKPELPAVAVCQDCQYTKGMEAALVMVVYSEDGLPF
jgi:hypothetical protein